MTTATEHQPAPRAVSAQSVETSFDIAGMTCASCVRRVEKALTRVDGVVAASVNLATETATVTYDPSPASVDALAAAVDKAGLHRDPAGGEPGPRDV